MFARQAVCAALLLSVCPPAWADDAAPPMFAYRAVLDAQYAARQAPAPVRPEEAQRVYENYLQSIGKPTHRPAIDSDTNVGNPSR